MALAVNPVFGPFPSAEIEDIDGFRDRWPMAVGVALPVFTFKPCIFCGCMRMEDVTRGRTVGGDVAGLCVAGDATERAEKATDLGEVGGDIGGDS